MNNFRLIVQPIILFNLIKPWLKVFSLRQLIPFHFKIDTFRQAEEQGSRGAEEKLFVSFIW